MPTDFNIIRFLLGGACIATMMLLTFSYLKVAMDRVFYLIYGWVLG
jgi:hypothetical protein